MIAIVAGLWIIGVSVHGTARLTLGIVLVVVGITLAAIDKS